MSFLRISFVAGFLGCALYGSIAQAESTTDTKHLPLTTQSEDARRKFRSGQENIENQQTQRAQLDFRAALRADSNFALAHLFLAYDNGNPAEQKAELEKARAASASASKPEQLLVEWLAGSREGKMVPSISAMNDLLASFPEDRFVLFLAGRWMVQQRNFESAQQLLERAVKLYPDYPAALNGLAYAYAGTGDFDRAFASLDKYSKVLPGEPNTEDSYGEISRLAGRYDQALTHYRKALEYDPAFVWSQLGIADTYSLMGQQEKAREEYVKAIASAPSVSERLDWEIQSALTYVYAHQHGAADRALKHAAEDARALHVGRQAASANRLMSEFATDYADMMEHSKAAEAALNEKSDISASDRDEEMALILKVRAVRAAEFHQFRVAEVSLAKLAKMAEQNHDALIQLSNEGAQGGVLFARKKFALATSHLEEDEVNPLSAARLVLAYRVTGDAKTAQVLSERLENYHEPLLEDHLARQLLKKKN